MVIIGSDVEALYPSLQDVQVAEIIYKAVMESKVMFDGVDYQEGARYIALNSTEQECRTGPLGRILPRRRFVNGSRPGVTGAGPLGPEVGDQEQWVFPRKKLSALEKRMVVAMTLKMAVLMLFRSHVYSFGGKFFLQKAGGPIGLRSTCCIARLVMMWWDKELITLMANSNLTLVEKARYMDDIRLWMYGIRLGWRWEDNQLCFSMKWRLEERGSGMTVLEKTVEVLSQMMNSVCVFLNLTMETVMDFEGVLPSLDLNIWVREEDNKTMYTFFEKPMASDMVIQREAAMPENMKISSLNQEMVRRMVNTSELVPMKTRLDIVDRFGQKLTDSGFGLKHVRGIIVGGLTRYERRLALSLDKDNPKWRPLHEGASFNAGPRRIKKMLSKNNWFKKNKVEGAKNDQNMNKRNKVEDGVGGLEENGRNDEPADESKARPSHRKVVHSNIREQTTQRGSWRQMPHAGGLRTGHEVRRKEEMKQRKRDPPTIAVLFIDSTPGAVLVKRLQEAEDRMAVITDYRVRMTEMSGTQLCRLLPNTNPWGEQDCQRPDCYTCNQSGEGLESCKLRNVLYESVCMMCNKDLLEKKNISKKTW